MNIMKKKIEIKTYQRKNGYPASYYATETEMSNPNFRSAKPAVNKTQFGHFRNGRITSVRSNES